MERTTANGDKAGLSWAWLRKVSVLGNARDGAPARQRNKMPKTLETSMNEWTPATGRRESTGH